MPSVTAPDLFRNFLIKQIGLLLENHRHPIEPASYPTVKGYDAGRFFIRPNARLPNGSGHQDKAQTR
ncbi:hypothetical protein E1B25_15620 [Antarcticimicrobium sediminis]|uniref:Uncharacterized protein n=1 Tax=Antarcticimicrobium sediminis TaxID=2546227 RepID=A0A4R5EMJ0_9RHOB|nr:hypothetical protein [Antarcticimicrobium sediminis]TDE35915.1 hypothetical protein E1B25_15620 [Antarcticimicrobium sediminis]